MVNLAAHSGDGEQSPLAVLGPREPQHTLWGHRWPPLDNLTLEVKVLRDPICQNITSLKLSWRLWKIASPLRPGTPYSPPPVLSHGQHRHCYLASEVDYLFTRM